MSQEGPRGNSTYPERLFLKCSPLQWRHQKESELYRGRCLSCADCTGNGFQLGMDLAMLSRHLRWTLPRTRGVAPRLSHSPLSAWAQHPGERSGHSEPPLGDAFWLPTGCSSKHQADQHAKDITLKNIRTCECPQHCPHMQVALTAKCTLWDFCAHQDRIPICVVFHRVQSCSGRFSTLSHKAMSF